MNVVDYQTEIERLQQLNQQNAMQIAHLIETLSTVSKTNQTLTMMLAGDDVGDDAGQAMHRPTYLDSPF